MKTLFRACAVCLFWFGFAHAAVEGDPFSDGQAFSDLHAIEASDTFLLGGFAESRNISPERSRNPDFPAAESAGRGALAARRLVAFRQP